MARTNTGTYLLVKETGPLPVEENPSRPDRAGPPLTPAQLPEPSPRGRIRRRAIALQPPRVDPGLAVWLDPTLPAVDRLYRAAAPLYEALGPRVILSGLTPDVPLDLLASNLAGAACARYQTALVDAVGGIAERLGLSGEGSDLAEALARRRLDPTAPLDLLGVARGLDVLLRGDLSVPVVAEDPVLRTLLTDLAARAALVLVAVSGPPLAKGWSAWATGCLYVARAAPPGELPRPPGGLPAGLLLCDCPPR